MTASPEAGLNEAARDAGAQGSIVKSGQPAELLAGLRAVAAGGEVFDPRHPQRARGRGALSPRAREALRLVAAGATNRGVAEALGVGEQTVKTLLERAFLKLGARRRAEVLAELKRRLPALPVIVLTAEQAPAERARAVSLGANLFLTKPFSPGELLAAVERLLGTPATAGAESDRDGGAQSRSAPARPR